MPLPAIRSSRDRHAARSPLCREGPRSSSPRTVVPETTPWSRRCPDRGMTAIGFLAPCIDLPDGRVAIAAAFSAVRRSDADIQIAAGSAWSTATFSGANSACFTHSDSSSLQTWALLATVPATPMYSSPAPLIIARTWFVVSGHSPRICHQIGTAVGCWPQAVPQHKTASSIASMRGTLSHQSSRNRAAIAMQRVSSLSRIRPRVNRRLIQMGFFARVGYTLV